jgi:hypothetical protein
MYLPSDTPILQKQRASAARNAACSDARIAAMRRTSATGRVNSFLTTVDPSQVAESLGIGAAVNTENLQNQTIISRATGLLGTGSDYSSAAGGSPAGSSTQPSVQQIIRNAPKVVSLNRGGNCRTGDFTKVPLGPDPSPGMPARAPAIVQTPAGPMNFQGAPSTIQGDYPPLNPSVVFASKGPASGPSMPTQYLSILPAAGMAGYSPSWGNADLIPPPAGPASSGVLGWITSNPWWALLIAGGGVYAFSKRGRR